MSGGGQTMEPAQIRAAAARARGAGRRLRAMDGARLGRSLEEAALRLMDPRSPLGAEARETLPESSGLSPAMLEWALQTSLREVNAPSVGRLRARARASEPELRPIGLLGLILSANVITAPTRAVLVPLALGVPVLAKASAREARYAELLRRALLEADPELGEAFEVLAFGRDRRDLETALLAEAEALGVYGGDGTIEALEGRWGDERPFLAHGHGLGAAYLPPSSLQGERAIRASVEALALDVGAYDQRGCLSPQFVFVARGAGLGARELASRLSSEGLSALEEALPRGELPLALEAAQMQWRGVAAAIGELFEGPRCATSFEPGLRPRLSPGHRHVSVLECEDLEEFLGVLRLFGGHLKALGVGGGVEERRRVAEALGPAQRPLISPLGQMQTPALDAETDGRSCWEGLFVRRR